MVLPAQDYPYHTPKQVCQQAGGMVLSWQSSVKPVDRRRERGRAGAAGLRPRRRHGRAQQNASEWWNAAATAIARLPSG